MRPCHVMGNAQKMIRDLLESLVREGKERGVQLAACHKGKLVVDAWAGTLDGPGTPAVDGDSLFPVFSATKGITATILHRLVERGKVSYQTPIAEVWPAFGAEDKGDITVRHALSHSAGLPYMPVGIGFEQIGNWKTMCDAVAALAPAWPAGQRMVYHAVTYSWLVGEVACRVSGKTFAQLLEDEIRRPLGIRDLYIGTPEGVEGRIAVLDEPNVQPLNGDDVPADRLPVPRWMQPLHVWMNRPDIRRACIPGSNGIMSARALARHYAALLPGGVDGVELLPPSRVREATRPQKPTKPLPTDAPMNIALGYNHGGEGSEMGGPAAFGHGGYGGSIGFADPTSHLAVGFTRNLFVNNVEARASILRALREALEA